MPYSKTTGATSLGIIGLNRTPELDKRPVHTFLLNDGTERKPFPLSVDTTSATLSQLMTAISKLYPKAKDTHHFNLVIGDIKLPLPHSDEALRQLLESQIARDDMRITVEAIKLKIFTRFKMKDVCKLYNLEYDSANPISQFPRFKCQVEPVDEKLLDYLVEELILRTAVTPITYSSEAHTTIYIYPILLAVSNSISRDVQVMPERLIVGAMAKGRAEYALETAEDEILGVTEVKSQDFNAGIAQNAMQIRSAVEQNRRRAIGGVAQRPRCFGIATDAHIWYFLEYSIGEIPKVSAGYPLGFRGSTFRKELQQVAGIIKWLLLEGLKNPLA